MTSINFNASATTALRTLQQTNSALETTQNRVATGLKIGEAKDNAAYWAISTTLKSDNKSLATVKDALNLGAATVDTAYQGLNKAKDVLDEIKSKLTAATQDGVDRNVIQSEIAALQDQLTSIASSSTFSGENWLSIDSSDPSFNEIKSIVASFARDSNNAVTIGTVDVDVTTVALFDSNGQSGIIDGAKALLDANGDILTVGGANAAAVPATDALDFSGTGTGTGVQAAAGASVSLGSLNLAGVTAGDKLKFDLTVDGSTGVVELSTSGLTLGNFEGSLQDAVDLAVGAGLATVSVGPGGEVKITAASSGTASAISAGATSIVDGDGTATARAGFLTNASLPAPVFGTSEQAAATTGGTYVFAAPAAGDKINFNVQYGSTVRQVEVTFAGTEGDADDVAAAMQTAIDAAFAGSTFNGSGAVYAAGDISAVATAAGDGFTLTSADAGADQAVGLTSLTSTPLATGVTVAGFGGATDSVSDGTSQTGPVGYGTAAAATLTIGTFSNTGVTANDRISMTVNVSGAQHTIVVSTSGLTGVAGDIATDASKLKTRVQAALDAAFGANTVTFDIDGAQNMTLATTAVGDGEYVAVANITALDGDGVSSQKAGLTTLTTDTPSTGTAGSAATVASVTSGTAFTGPQTIGADDTISFDVTVDGNTTTITIDQTKVKAALSNSNVIDDAADYVTVLNSVLGAVGVSASDAGGGVIKLDKTSAAGVGTLSVSNVSASAGADTISVETIDISDAALAAVGVDGTNRKEVLSAYITLVNNAITSVTTAAANLGAVSSRIDMQNSFVDTLIDTIDKGVSNLVDADLSEESTKLQALQTKQQLGIQALSIANSSQQNILRLFQ